MDEIDAALDFKNVSIVAHYIKERTKNAQFIIISLRNNMFELADRLVGIYKYASCPRAVREPLESNSGPRARRPVQVQGPRRDDDHYFSQQMTEPVHGSSICVGRTGN